MSEMPQSHRVDCVVLQMAPSTDNRLYSSLRRQLTGRCCIVGVGNRTRGDDGAGPRVIDQARISPPNVSFDVGTTPENYLEPIVATCPHTVLIVDAVDFGGHPGECRLLDSEALFQHAVSTHSGSLNLIADYLATRSGASVQILGIQPVRLDRPYELSPPVGESVQRIAAMLSELLGDDGQAESQ